MIDFLYYSSICLLVWLGVGFIMGLKIVFWDRNFNKEKIDKAFSSVENDEKNSEAEKEFLQGALKIILKNKLNLIIFVTLSGFIPLFADLYKTVTFKKES